jgi:hypothetical protein
VPCLLGGVPEEEHLVVRVVMGSGGGGTCLLLLLLLLPKDLLPVVGLSLMECIVSSITSRESCSILINDSPGSCPQSCRHPLSCCTS